MPTAPPARPADRSPSRFARASTWSGSRKVTDKSHHGGEVNVPRIGIITCGPRGLECFSIRADFDRLESLVGWAKARSSRRAHRARLWWARFALPTLRLECFSIRLAPRIARSALQRSASLLPGVDAAVDVAGRSKTRLPRGLNRHGGAFAKGAVEQEPFAGGLGEFVKDAAAADILLQRRVRHVQRARNDAVAFALATLAQVDERDLGLADQAPRLLCRYRPATAGDLLLRQADLHVGGYGDIHHLRVGELEV